MPNSKTLFDAVEVELRNARAAINSAGAYMDMIKKTVDEIEKSTGMEAPLSLKNENEYVAFGFAQKAQNGELG
jgi:hypothetical protein